MESTWAHNTSHQTLDEFQSDFAHLKMIIELFTKEMSASDTSVAPYQKSGVLDTGCSYRLVFPHGYDVVSQALSQPEGVQFVGFFSKRLPEAAQDVLEEVARTDEALIQELQVNTTICKHPSATDKDSTVQS